MDWNLIEIGGLAFIAALILFRLYAVLGRRTGTERPEPRPAPAQGDLSRLAAGLTQPRGTVQPLPASDGVMAILRADPNFDVEKFLKGARAAYEMIVGAFAKGDRDALRERLTPRVFDMYSAAIAQREEKGGVGPELVRLRRAEMTDAAVEGNIARVGVKFEAELADGPERVRDAREKWTFERDVRSPDPNWRLARVSMA
ncbi:MAG: Tim44/TimA family putative adaptor protein [Alphaproteobacteria bacterium]